MNKQVVKTALFLSHDAPLSGNILPPLSSQGFVELISGEIDFDGRGVEMRSHQQHLREELNTDAAPVRHNPFFTLYDFATTAAINSG